ncbi:MAG: hypothetical protein LBD09_01125 [Treponema sp.]|jgi:hypothetical protein|nr:hypothetical protein [Treponema sp.]
MKKPLLAAVFLLAASLSFGQIYRGEGEGKGGPVAFSLHFVEYAGYRYLLLIDGVSVFMEEAALGRLEAILEKFRAWEAIAAESRAALTKTIDSITFDSFHYSHAFFREPLVFYFVFTGGPLAAAAEETPVGYTLFIDTTLDRIAPFRLSSEAAAELLEALSPEHLAEAREAWEQQKALEDLFR